MGPVKFCPPLAKAVNVSEAPSNEHDLISTTTTTITQPQRMGRWPQILLHVLLALLVVVVPVSAFVGSLHQSKAS